MNMYTPTYIIADDDQPHGYREVPHSPSYPKMFTDWLYICPQITYWGPRFARELWDVPAIYITENGCPCDDQVNAAGKVEDTDRVMYVRNHLLSLQRAVRERVPMQGYFVWSMMDNFEWVARLRRALRHHPRRLRHARTHAQTQRRLLPRGDQDGPRGLRRYQIT